MVEVVIELKNQIDKFLRRLLDLVPPPVHRKQEGIHTVRSFVGNEDGVANPFRGSRLRSHFLRHELLFCFKVVDAIKKESLQNKLSTFVEVVFRECGQDGHDAVARLCRGHGEGSRSAGC